jgi:hypothetical protein
LVAALLFKVQWWLGVEGQWQLLTLATYTGSAIAGYRCYRWFIDL